MTGCCSLVFSFFLLLYLITGVTVTSMLVYMLH